MANNKKIAAITCHLTHEDQQAVLNLADQAGVTASEWVRGLIAGRLDDMRRDVISKAEILGVRKELMELVELRRDE